MEPTDLTRRLDRLERENRWMKFFGGLVALVVVAVATMAALPKPRIVEAEMFIVRDLNGKIRVVLGQDTLSDTVPRSPIIVGPPNSANDTYGLSIYASDGRMRAQVAHWFDEGGGHLKLGAKDTVSAASLLVSDGLSMLTLRGTERSRGEDERARRDFATRFNAARSVEERAALRNPSDQGHQIKMLAFKDGPSVSLGDQEGVDRAVLGHTVLKTLQTGSLEHRAPSSLALFDKDGKVIWTAP
jgi:hypothetical protein